MTKRSAPGPNKAAHENLNESYVYTIGKRQAIVTPIYKENGENFCDILLRLMCIDESATKND